VTTEQTTEDNVLQTKSEENNAEVAQKKTTTKGVLFASHICSLVGGCWQIFNLNKSQTLDLSFQNFSRIFLFASGVWPLVFGAILCSEEYVAESMICTHYGQTATLVKRIFHENLLHADCRHARCASVKLVGQRGKSMNTRLNRRTATLDNV